MTNTLNVKPVLVTTAHRGVFYGYVDVQTETERSLVLTKCRNVIYWQTPNGLLDLARIGPNKKCRIGAEATRALLHDITALVDVTDKAAAVFDNWDPLQE